MDLVVGIDSSTTATKAIAWDREGRPVAEGRAPIPLSNPQDGWLEQDPDDWWVSAVAALRGLAVDPARIAAVAISNQRETFGVFDEAGRALRPAMLWLDERARPQVRSFSESFGADRLHRISGKPPDLTPAVYRFAWLAEHESEVFGRVEKVADVHAFLTFRFTGAWTTSTASADPLGILDMAGMALSAEILGAVGLDPARFPRLARPGTQTGELSVAAARETGLRPGTPVIAAGGDGQCAGTGTATLGAGRAYANLGTAVVSGSYGRTYRADPAFRTLSAVADEGYIYESCLRTGTFLLDWAVRTLFGIDLQENPGIFRQLEAEAAAVPIGSGGIALVPYWSGVMTPYWDTDARGIIAGFSASHRRGHVYRALLEGIALEQAAMTDRVAEATGEPIDHYVAIGGGAASDLWCSILADASGRAVLRSATVEASSLGAGMAAAKGARWFPTIADAAGAMAGEAVRTFEPNEERRARYGELLAIHRDLWPTLAAWNARLVRFAEGAR